MPEDDLKTVSRCSEYEHPTQAVRIISQVPHECQHRCRKIFYIVVICMGRDAEATNYRSFSRENGYELLKAYKLGNGKIATECS
jgi:hypothetical protein